MSPSFSTELHDLITNHRAAHGVIDEMIADMQDAVLALETEEQELATQTHDAKLADGEQIPL